MARHTLTAAVAAAVLLLNGSAAREIRADSYWSIAVDTRPEEASGAISVASYNFWNFFGSPFLLTFRFEWTINDEVESAHIRLVTAPGFPPGAPPNPPLGEGPPNEPPVDEPPVDEPPVDEPPVDEPPVDEPPIDEPPGGEPPVGEPPIGAPADEQIVLDLENGFGGGLFSIHLHCDRDLLGPLAGQTLSALEDAFQSGIAVFDLHTQRFPEGIQGLVLGMSAVEEPSTEEPPVEEPPVEEPPVEEPPVEEPPVEE